MTARARGPDAEGDVGHAQRGLDARQRGLDVGDPLDRLDGRRPPLLVTRRQGEGEDVEDEQLGVQAVLVAADLLDPRGDLDLALGGLRHADLVDRQRDDGGAVLDRERDDDIGLVATGLEVDRVHDGAAGDLLERELDHVGLGRVDLDGGGLGQRDALGDLAHLLVLVGALGQRDAQVQDVGAALDLILRDADETVVVVVQQHLLGGARALRVDALADQRGRGVLRERRRRDHRRHARRPGLGAREVGPRGALDALGDRGDVLRRGATAAADDRHAVALDEVTEGVGERLGLLGEDGLTVGALEGDARVRDAVDRNRAVLAEVAHRVAHVLWAR